MPFCTHCGNKLEKADKFCTKCGKQVTIQTESASDNMRATVENLHETVNAAADVVKQTADKAVQQSKEFIQSEQFQSVKSETVKRTRKFFDCSILSDEEYRNSISNRRKHIYILTAVICIVIALLPMQNYVGDNNFGILLKVVDIIGIVAIVPIMIILGIKIGIMSKEIHRYSTENHVVDINFEFPVLKYTSIMVIFCIVTAILTNHWANYSIEHGNISIEEIPMRYLESLDVQENTEEYTPSNSSKRSVAELLSQYPELTFIVGTPQYIKRIGIFKTGGITQTMEVGYYEGVAVEEEAIRKECDLLYQAHIVTHLTDGTTVDLDVVAPDPEYWYKHISSSVNQYVIGVQTLDDIVVAINLFDSREYDIDSKFVQPN